MNSTTERAQSFTAHTDSYHEHGFVVVRSIFNTGEMAERAEEANSLLERSDLIDSHNIRCRGQNCQD